MNVVFVYGCYGDAVYINGKKFIAEDPLISLGLFVEAVMNDPKINEPITISDAFEYCDDWYREVISFPDLLCNVKRKIK